jgi:hypothetical protein
MIDKLSLTTFIEPAKEYLELHGNITIDENRVNIFKYLAKLDKAVILYCPHKYSDNTNANIPFTKVDLNPKYFECYDHMEAYLFAIFDRPDLSPEDFNVSRIDIAVDLQNFPIDRLLSMLRIKKIRSDSLSFYKGTIYAGSDPKIRIYEKTKEIKSRLKKGYKITDYEKKLLASGNSYTRFEIQIRNVKKTLKEIKDDPASLASYFDRLEIFDLQKSDDIGVLQILYKYINRKFRKELEKYKNSGVVEEIKKQYIDSVTSFFNSDKEPF